MTETPLTPEQLTSIRHAISEFDAAIRLVAPQVLEASKAIGKAYGILWENYQHAGAPHGETREGMLQFYEEHQMFRNIIETHQEQSDWEKAISDLRERFRDFPGSYLDT
jgi:hypothetical protein